MDKKAGKMLDRILNFTLLISMVGTLVFAASGDVQSVIDDLNGGKGVYGTISEIMGILLWLGFAIAVIKAMQIGIMFIIGGGSGKNNAKTALVPWLIGAAVCALFGTVGPWIIDIIMSGSTGGVFDI